MNQAPFCPLAHIVSSCITQRETTTQIKDGSVFIRFEVYFLNEAITGRQRSWDFNLLFFPCLDKCWKADIHGRQPQDSFKYEFPQQRPVPLRTLTQSEGNLSISIIYEYFILERLPEKVKDTSCIPRHSLNLFSTARWPVQCVCLSMSVFCDDVEYLC